MEPIKTPGCYRKADIESAMNREDRYFELSRLSLMLEMCTPSGYVLAGLIPSEDVDILRECDVPLCMVSQPTPVET